jgi:hypothetical protein
MIEMGVRQKHLVEPVKAEPGAHQLALRAFAAIDEKPARAAADLQGGRTPLGRMHRCGRADKDEVEHYRAIIVPRRAPVAPSRQTIASRAGMAIAAKGIETSVARHSNVKMRQWQSSMSRRRRSAN